MLRSYQIHVSFANAYHFRRVKKCPRKGKRGKQDDKTTKKYMGDKHIRFTHPDVLHYTECKSIHSPKLSGGL